jgi:dihydrofolate reductase
MSSQISLIAVIGKNRELGKNGGLLWHLPDDMQRFKAITSGHPVIMGRKTWESIPETYRPLADRTNIVLTREVDYEATGAVVAHSLEDALAEVAGVEGEGEVFIIGGGELYRETLPLAGRLYLTIVDASAEADTYFPEYHEAFGIAEEHKGEGDPLHHFQLLKRK